MTLIALPTKMLLVALGTLSITAVCFVMFSGPAHAQDSRDAERLKEIHRTVMDPNQMFSISATLAELDSLEPQIQADDVRSRGKLNYIRGFVLYRAGRAAESIAPRLEALSIDANTPFLTKGERARFIYSLANQAEELGEWDIAIGAYRKVVPLFDADPERSEDERLGTRERLAFCLHEAGKYQEATAVNKEVLAGCERLFGPDSEKLLVVVTNLAQNAYKMRQFGEAKGLLERRLSIATKRDDQSHIDDSLFQLGVLAFEQGQPGKAETFMKQRLELAKASGDAERIEDAEQALQILYEKTGR